ncbi:hypothetical protein RJ641_006389 [Dillenia turbinata]|uniref:Oxidative stress 3 n=1 Tax=Dillenia turbinata TaxID=194707 RepID=A0AAN8ZBR0_9MAGN
MSSSLMSQQSKLGIMDEVDSMSSNSSDALGVESSDSESFIEEVNPSASSSASSLNQNRHQNNDDPVQDMTSLLQQLPFKRGLSKHYQGKSQSFTSLSSVRCLEDLAKPENPIPYYNKKLKSCKSYAGGLSSPSLFQVDKSFSRHISKKASSSSSRNASCSSPSARSGGGNFTGNKPPNRPHRSPSTNNLSNQTPPLFA